MKKDVYEIIKFSWSYNSQRENKYIGTIDELRNIVELKRLLQNKKPRTINGLKKILDKYAREQTSIYTGITYDVYKHYGEYKIGLQ